MDITVLKMLADERRLAIVNLLAERGELCVCDVASALDMSTALVSHHVSKLRDAGLVRMIRVGRWHYCSLESDRLVVLAEELTSTATRAEAAIEANAGRGCACNACGEGDGDS